MHIVEDPCVAILHVVSLFQYCKVPMGRRPPLGHPVILWLFQGFAQLDVTALNNMLFRAMGAWMLHQNLRGSSGPGTEPAMDALMRELRQYQEQRECRDGKGAAGSHNVHPSSLQFLLTQYHCLSETTSVSLLKLGMPLPNTLHFHKMVGPIAGDGGPVQAQAPAASPSQVLEPSISSLLAVLPCGGFVRDTHCKGLSNPAYAPARVIMDGPHVRTSNVC